MPPDGVTAFDCARLSLQPVRGDDFEAMLALRVEAMRPSLERIGRFDPQRARERLAAGFAPAFMHHIAVDGGERIGFVTLRPEGGDALRLDHLYLRNAWQGRGIGTWALDWVKRQARERGLAVKVTALKASDANRFYRQHGFVPDGGPEGWDVHYRWPAAAEPA